jgi:hypothetical protein
MNLFLLLLIRDTSWTSVIVRILHRSRVMNPGTATILLIALAHYRRLVSCCQNVEADAALDHVSFGGAHLG